MIRWLRALLGPGPASRRELMACRDAIDALDARVDLHYAETKSLRGKVHALSRYAKEAQPAEPDAATPQEHEPPRRAATIGTEHLSRRFKLGG